MLQPRSVQNEMEGWHAGLAERRGMDYGNGGSHRRNRRTHQSAASPHRASMDVVARPAGSEAHHASEGRFDTPPEHGTRNTTEDYRAVTSKSERGCTMMSRIRRALKVPARKQSKFSEEMRCAREEAVLESRATIHRLNHLRRVLGEGDIDYNELNQAMFGRPGWPRKERP